VQLRQLQRITAELAEALTLDDVARVLLAFALRLPRVGRAGLAVVHGGGRELRFVPTDGDAVSAAGVRWCRIDALSDVPLAQAVRTGAPVHLPSLKVMQQRYPHLVERQESLGTRAMSTLPLAAAEQTLGGLLLSFDSQPRLTPADKTFLMEVAEQAGHAVRRALAYERQRATSQLLQRSLLPESLPELPGLALGAHYEPGVAGVEVGGDWFEVLPLADGSVVVALGDVMGKGLTAATVMGQVRAGLRAFALVDSDPSTVLARVNLLVGTLGVPDQLVTAVCGLVSPDRSTVRVASAGHLPPLLVPPAARPAFVTLRPGPPLGLGDGGSWPSVEVSLAPDEVVLLFTDGLVESRRRPVAAGMAALLDAAGAPEAARHEPRELCARLAASMLRPDSGDDVAMLAFAASGDRNLRRATTELPPDTSAPGLARRFLIEQLRAWGVADDVVETAQVCLSEIVTNAVIHSGTSPRVTISLDERRLLVLVQDSGHAGVPRLQHLAADDIGGRGLQLVEALASVWSSERSADGTTVWFELDLG
ncbi:MAG: SpoIIE family protein phosphatase, partial [Actinomycetota bacterium]|nr:SpoIIE family protein phosphatase [Actinomycetota bacterium]